MNIIGNVTVNGDIIESGATKVVNNYGCCGGESSSNHSAEEHSSDFFDLAKIESFVIEGHPKEVAEILYNLMAPMCGMKRPKEALLPLYCAIDLGMVRKPSYADFCSAFPELEIKKSSYSECLSMKDNSIYNSKDIERMSEAISGQLNEKTK